MFQNTFEKYLNVVEHFWNVSKINFWNVFKTNLRYFITLWNVFKQTKSFRRLWKIEQSGHVDKQIRIFSNTEMFVKHIWFFKTNLYMKNFDMFTFQIVPEQFAWQYTFECSGIIWNVSKQIWIFWNILKTKQSTKQVEMVCDHFFKKISVCSGTLFLNVSKTNLIVSG